MYSEKRPTISKLDKSDIIKVNGWKAYRIELNEWKKDEKNGTFISVHKYEKNAIDREWKQTQLLTVNNKEEAEQIAKEINEFSQKLKSFRK